MSEAPRHLRVTVYHAGQRVVPDAVWRTPGEALDEDTLDAAHILIGRAIGERGTSAGPETTFVAPMRVRGRLPGDADLSDGATLATLLCWPTQAAAPDLAVVIVNLNGEGGTPNLNELRELVRDVDARLTGVTRPNRVLGVAVPEIEGWLLADPNALTAVLGETAADECLPQPESTVAGQARWKLHDAITRHSALAPADAQRQLARAMNLDVLERRCRGFRALRRELRSV